MLWLTTFELKYVRSMMDSFICGRNENISWFICRRNENFSVSLFVNVMKNFSLHGIINLSVVSLCQSPALVAHRQTCGPCKRRRLGLACRDIIIFTLAVIVLRCNVRKSRVPRRINLFNTTQTLPNEGIRRSSVRQISIYAASSSRVSGVMPHCEKNMLPTLLRANVNLS